MAVQGADKVLRNIEIFFGAMHANAVQAMAEIMAMLEGFAKTEHPYTDRTANNTNSISGQIAEVSEELVRGVLSAGMEYSVFLELANNGKYAFLWPVILRHEAEIMAILQARLNVNAQASAVVSEHLQTHYEAYKAQARADRSARRAARP